MWMGGRRYTSYLMVDGLRDRSRAGLAGLDAEISTGVEGSLSLFIWETSSEPWSGGDEDEASRVGDVVH